MSTPILHFTKDPDEDITNAPQYYHSFLGKGVRIQTYWTNPIWKNKNHLASSFRLIRNADAILQKYTLKLDSRPDPSRVIPYSPELFPGFSLSAISPMSVESPKDKAARAAREQTAAAAGLLNYDYSVTVPMEGVPSIEELKPLRKLIEPVTEENRLIVVFTPINGGPSGYTDLRAEWLPWVLVDPSHYDEDTTLLHEIGHACRLAHQQFATPAPPTQEAFVEASVRYRNVMTYGLITDRFWCWQVDAIYDSYWCTGSRPHDWWVRKVLPMDSPYLWEEV